MGGPTEVLIRFHEVALKGRNRPRFISALVDNVRIATQGLGVRRVWPDHLQVRMSLHDPTWWDSVRKRLSMVSGIAKFSIAHRVQPNYDSIEQLERRVISELESTSFRISSHRADKRFPLTSHELNVRLGALVQKERGMPVDLSNPDLDIRVEVLPRDAFVYINEERGAGGLPVGTGGRAVCLMSGGIDSPVAAWRMIHRGCRVTLVHFHSFPLVEGRSREKAKELAEIIAQYQYNSRLYLVPFADLQKEIILSVPGPLRVVAYRRFMLRIAEAIAVKEPASALVTGESLGQVSSQTIENIATIDQAVQMPVLRPLVGMDKQEIIEQAYRLGTYETSILPDEDCCSLFVPRSPATRVRISQVEPLEDSLDIARLVSQGVAGAELFEYGR